MWLVILVFWIVGAHTIYEEHKAQGIVWNHTGYVQSVV